MRHALSKAADVLGVSRRMMAYYSNSEKKAAKPILPPAGARKPAARYIRPRDASPSIPVYSLDWLCRRHSRKDREKRT